MKVIFLDVDGVLNGYNKYNIGMFDLAKKLGLLKLLRSNYDIFGVRTWKVFLLSIIVKTTKSKVVISSSWRYGWDKPYEEKVGSQKELHDKLKMFGVEIAGRTGTVHSEEHYSHRELEIKKWLDKNGRDVTRFIVLDDEQTDLQGFVGKELIRTSERDYICGRNEEDTGLKIKHVIRAIKVLNGK